MFSHNHPRQEGSPIPDGLEVAAININQVLYYNVHIMFLPSISSVTYLQMARVKLLNFCTDATHWKRSANVHPPTKICMNTFGWRRDPSVLAFALPCCLGDDQADPVNWEDLRAGTGVHPNEGLEISQ